MTRRLLSAVSALVMAAVLGSGEAGAASGWTIHPSPNRTGATDTRVGRVSCTASNACTAVGFSRGSGGAAPSLTLAERWNGTKWVIQPTPNHPGSHLTVFTDVSCTAANTCTAVGDYLDSTSTNRTLAQHWNGSTWAFQPTANPPAGTNSYLEAVSCTSAAACTAVGRYQRGAVDVTLAERWDGRSWTIQTTPNPSGSDVDILCGVACTTAPACMAVGISYQHKTGNWVTLAERWNGSTWALQSTPNPMGTTYNGLSGVSCTAPDACIAVGRYATSSGPTSALAERWNGITWSIEPITKPTGVRDTELVGVSCSAISVCTAVGTQDPGGASPTQTLAELLNGAVWTAQPTPNPAGATFSYLAGVSCTAATTCRAVGYYYRNYAGPNLALAEGES